MSDGARCRNCGSPAPGAYCAACGQETRARLPTLREFGREAAGRYVALDGTLWRTLGALVFRPGFLTREYLDGRRRRYVRPFRLYLAASLLCFLVAGLKLDPAGIYVADLGDDAGAPASANGKADAKAAGGPPRTATVSTDGLDVVMPKYLKPAERALRARIKRFEALDPAQRIQQLTAGVRRYAPYAMFALVPAFALLLKLVYPRRRGHPQRPSLYGEHLVFAVHSHAFFFLAATLAALVPQPLAATAWTWAALYPVLALRRVYGGRWIGAAARAVALIFLYLPLVIATIGALIMAAVVIG